jgi:cardiolipin synthase
MEAAYLADLERSTEVVLGARRPRRPLRPRRAAPRARKTRGERRASSGLAAAGALRLGHTVGAALGGYRVLGPAEAALLALAGGALLALAAVALLFPRIAAVPLGLVGLWLGVALLVKALRVRALARRVAREEAESRAPAAGPAPR